MNQSRKETVALQGELQPGVGGGVGRGCGLHVHVHVRPQEWLHAVTAIPACPHCRRDPQPPWHQLPPLHVAPSQVLSLSGNQLRALPEALGALSALEVLSADDNKLEALPGSLGEPGCGWVTRQH